MIEHEIARPQAERRAEAARRPPVAPAATDAPAPAIVSAAPAGALCDVLARSVAVRASAATGGPLLMRNGGGTETEAPVDPGARLRAALLEHVSAANLDKLLRAFELTDIAALAPLLEDAGYDVAGLELLADALKRRNATAVLGGRLLRKLRDPHVAYKLVLATMVPNQLPRLLEYMRPPVLRTLLLFERPDDPSWLLDVCVLVNRDQEPWVITLFEEAPRDLLLPLLAQAQPRVILRMLPLIADPAQLVALLELIPDRDVLADALRLEKRGARLVPICRALTSHREELPTLLKLVADRTVLLNLALAEGDGRVLATLLPHVQPDVAALAPLLAVVGDRAVLATALANASAVAGPPRAAGIVGVLARLGLLDAAADRARLGRIAAIIGDADALGVAPDEALVEVSEFDFYDTLTIAALKDADATRAKAVKDETERLEGLQKTEEEAVRKTHETAVLKSGGGLSGKHTKGLGKPKNSDDYQKAIKALNGLVETAAKPELDAIKLRYQQQIDTFVRVGADQIRTARKTAYRDYYKAVGYDQDALALLGVAGGDFAVAGRIHGAVTAAPQLRAAALAKQLSVGELERLLTLPDPPRTALFASLDAATLRAFAGSTQRIDLLGALGIGGVGTAKIQGCVAKLADLDTYLAGQHVPLAALVQAYDATRTEALLKLAPGAARPSFVNGLRPHAADFAALEGCLAFAKALKCDQATINGAVLQQPAGSSRQVLRDAIRDDVAATHRALDFDDQTVFNNWMNFVAVLLGQKACTISCGQTGTLPPIPTLAFTTETICTVNPLGDTFVLHTHPWITLTSDKSSRYHVKPYTGNSATPHMYSNTGHHSPKMPKAVQDKLPSLAGIKGLYPIQ